MLRFVKYSILILLMFLTHNAVAQETCCWRFAGTLPVPMPPGQEDDYGGMIASAFTSAFMDPSLNDCPLMVDFMSYEGSKELDRMVDAIGKACGAQPDPEVKKLRARMHGFMVDYLFMGTLTAYNAQSIDGNLYGQFTLQMKLLDNCPSRGDVVKQGQTSWDGWISDDLGEIKALGETFMPLDDLIYDYERTPEDCEIAPEKDPVKLGETITINLQNIVDGKGRTPQPWQRLLVKVEKGEILNGVDQGEYHVFEAGSGSVEVEYKAPEECPQEKTDTITVENSCINCPETIMNFLPEREIASKEIEINCGGGGGGEIGGEIEYNHHFVIVYDLFYQEQQTMGRVPFYVEDSTIEGEGTVTRTITGHHGECSHSGIGPVEVRLSGEGESELNITFDEIWYMTLTFVCPDETWTETLPPVTTTFDLTFPLEDGHKIEQPYIGPGGTGTYSWTLHLNN